MTFTGAELSRDDFLGGKLSLYQPKQGYRAATDPVLLAAFTRARAGDAVLDLGCGVGTAGLCLARRVPGIVLHGLELQEAYASLAHRNARENGIALTVHTGDLRCPPEPLKQLLFDHVIANPPYVPGNAGSASPDAGRDTANREGEATLYDWVGTGLRRLRPQGQLVVIQRTERLQEILNALTGRAGAIEILPLASRVGRPAGRVLLRARKSSRTPLVLHAPLTLHKGNSHLSDRSDYTEDVMKVLYELSELLPHTR